MSSFRFSTRTAESTRRPTPPRTSSCRTSSNYTHGVGASSGPPKQAAHVATRHACCASHRSQLAPAATVGLEFPGALSNRSASTTNSLGRGGTGCRIASRPGHRTRRPRTIRWRRRNRQRPWSGDRKSFDAGPGSAGSRSCSPNSRNGTTDGHSRIAALVAPWARNADTDARYWAARQRVCVRCALCRKQLGEDVSLARSREILDRHLAHAHPKFMPPPRKLRR